MELRFKPRIGVMGPSSCSSRVYSLGQEVGFCIGREGAILICGGGSGVMEAAARGAKQAGGITIGILPGGKRDEANPYIDIPIITDLGNARNVINVLTSQVIISIHGAYGTLSEFALALKCGTPVVGLDTWNLISPEGEYMPRIIVTESPEEAVKAAIKLIQTK